MITFKTDSPWQTLRLELSTDTLLALLEAGHLAVADFRCLDCESKHCVRQLLLETCCRRLRSRQACSGNCDACSATRGDALAAQRQRAGKSYP